MPPRTLVIGILAFCLTADSWLFYREVWPYWRSGDPPPYTIDLTEELGNPSVDWDILKKNDQIGYATSSVKRQPNRTYKLKMEYTFEKLKIMVLTVRKLRGVYHITEDGDLLGMSANAKVSTGDQKFGDFEMEFDMQARVENGELVPELFFNKEKLALGDIRVPMKERTGTINPLHPVNRLPGLHEGRRWRITLFDPLSAIGKGMGPQFHELLGAMDGIAVRELHADVKADTLEWDEEVVPCYKIEYRKPGAPDPIAATWVRKRDGLVLQQHSSHGLTEMTLRRRPAK
jgi:hypothetical protein